MEPVSPEIWPLTPMLGMSAMEVWRANGLIMVLWTGWPRKTAVEVFKVFGKPRFCESPCVAVLGGVLHTFVLLNYPPYACTRSDTAV